MPLSLKMRTLLLMAQVTGGKPMNELPVSQARSDTTIRMPKNHKPAPTAPSRIAQFQARLVISLCVSIRLKVRDHSRCWFTFTEAVCRRDLTAPI